MFVPHASGVRLVVDEVLMRHAWHGVLEGVPAIERFLREAREDLALFPGREPLLVPVAWANIDKPLREGPGAIFNPERRAPETPRWLCTAAVRFDDGRPEGERRAAIAWFTNRVLSRDIETLLVDDIAHVPLDEPADARPPDAVRELNFVTSGDGAPVTPSSIRLRFHHDGVDAFADWAGRHHTLALPKPLPDAPVYARARFDGGVVEGPRNPDPDNLYTSELTLAWLAEAPTTPLDAFVQDAIGRVRWHELATPTEP